MTDPVLSSFAGRKPPNPVLAVTSGSPELEFDPFNLLVLEVFLSVLFVMSGIDLLLRKFVSMLFLISVLEVEGVKLKQGTVVALTPESDDLVGPLNNFLISLLPPAWTLLGGLKV